MIPETLHIRNFLSHRDTDLELRGVHVASLVGDNGAGKSALLDAITWAVWGQSRAPYGREDDLIFHGETGLEVEFVFIIPYQGGTEQRFRILRRREKRGRRLMSTQLDFQVESDDGWRILTADSVRATQKRIVEHLGLEYETFINSAYLRQGHADEFTVQTPAERKRVLGAVLGLERWVAYQDRAKSILTEYLGELKAVNTRLEEIESELVLKPDYEQNLATAEAEMNIAEQQLLKVQEEIDALTRAGEQSAALQRQMEDLDSRLQQESTRLKQLEADREKLHERNQHYEILLTQAGTIEQQYQQYQELINDERKIGEQLRQIAQLQQQKSQNEQALSIARQNIDRELRDIESSIATQERKEHEKRVNIERKLAELRSQMKLLEERLPGQDTLKTLDAARYRLREFDVKNGELQEYRQHLRGKEMEESRLSELNRQFRTQMDEAKTRINTLGQAEASCPLCGQPLTSEHREHLLEEISIEGKRMGDIYRSNQSHLKELTEAEDLLRGKIDTLELDLKLRPAQEQLVARLQQQIEQGEQARKRAVELNNQAAGLEQILADEQYAEQERDILRLLKRDLKNLQAQIDSQQYAPELRLALEKVNAEIDKVGYDDSQHEYVKSQIQALRHVEGLYHELENARTSSHRDQEMLVRLTEDIDFQQQRLLEMEKERKLCQENFNVLQPVLSRREELTQLFHKTRQTAAIKRQLLGAAKQNLAALDTLEQRSAVYREQRIELVRNTGLYSELRDAFGVNGIPAMIIEHTLPELEREANRILQQLTGGRMHVRFETQRETKAGTLRETLDIIISDEKGTRPYENFSGGEQFRVNFAIRVALSRLLARRSGVRLRSLFVDEGFGSLDADGRQRLVEAVKSVQDSFHLIMVITHIDELREAFPTQILVSKTDSGSVVEVV